MGLYADDVVVVAQFTRPCREAEVRDGRHADRLIVGWSQREAFSPAIVRFVLKFEGERFVLEVGQAGLCWDSRIAKSTRLISNYQWSA